MHRITIPAWTNRKTGEHKPSRSFNAELVETLLANSPQPPELIFKYYGDDAPAGAFKPSIHDRLVFHSEDSGYIIIPNIPPNKRMWHDLSS